MMRSGSQEWVTDSNRPPGHHCTDYEYTIQACVTYAARALKQMDLTRVDSSIEQEAQVAENHGRSKRRVTDPGWV